MLPDDEKEEIIKRRICCTTCPFNNINAKTSEEYLSLTTIHYKTKREDFHCSLCGCPLEVKTASLYANCGIEEWNESWPDKKLELKWKAIK